MDVEIQKVRTDEDRKEFFTLPFRIYRDNSYWVPPMIKEEKRQFNSEENPILDDCTIEMYLARGGGGEVLGRIVGIINHVEIRQSDRMVGRFGWLEAFDESDVFAALFGAVERWALTQNIEIIKGPYGFTNLDKSAMLVEGFDEMGALGTIYNLPYYSERVEELGYEKLVDYLEFELEVPEFNGPWKQEVVNRISNRFGVRLANIRSQRELMDHSGRIFELMNSAFQPIEGFVPFPIEWIEQYSQKFMRFLKPEYVAVVLDEVDKVVGFGITLPSFSKALQKSGGKLWPWGWWYYWKTYHLHNRADLVLIAVHPDYQNKGIHALIFQKTISEIVKNGVERVNAYPELETNTQVRNLFARFDGRQHKRRRIYIKDLHQ